MHTMTHITRWIAKTGKGIDAVNKKIAFITPSLLPMPPVKGGAMETLVDHLLCCNEVHHDFEITVFCVGDEQAREKAAGYRFTRFCYLPGETFFPKLNDLFVRGCRKLFHLELNPERAYAKRVTKALAREKYDLIIVENQPAFLSLVRKVSPRTSLWLHLHNHPDNFGKEGIAELLRCDGVLAVSDFIRREALRLAPLRAKQVLTFPNCVDTGRFDSSQYQQEREKIRDRFGIRDNDVVLMYSGRLTEEKGVGKLMEAFLQVDDPRLKLMLVGSDWYGSNGNTPFINQLQKLAGEAPKRVFLTGFIPFSEMPYYYAAADICAVPSVCEEASGLTVLEALAAGRPLIATDVGGIPENLSEDCAVVVPRDGKMVYTMAEAIRALKDDGELRRRMGEAGKKLVEARGIGQYYESFREILTEICGRSHAD